MKSFKKGQNKGQNKIEMVRNTELYWTWAELYSQVQNVNKTKNKQEKQWSTTKLAA